MILGLASQVTAASLVWASLTTFTSAAVEASLDELSVMDEPHVVVHMPPRQHGYGL